MNTRRTATPGPEVRDRVRYNLRVLPFRRLALPFVALATALALTACGGSGDPAPSQGSAHASAQGTLGPGFVQSPPAPESTIHPSPGSWDDVHPKPGYRVALLVDAVPSSASAQTRVLRTAVASWASSVQAQLTVFTARSAEKYVATIQQAIDAKPDLVISVGNGLVDPLAMVSAPNLETSFLVVGAEIAEPTSNVTAADWHGAMYRGEGLGIPESYDPATFTAERAGRAVRAGVAAVLNRLTGIVVEVD